MANFSTYTNVFRSGPDSPLSQLNAHYNTIPPLPLIIGHCFTTAAMNQDVAHRFLLHYWLCLAAGFGGGIVSAWLLMNAGKVPNEFLSINSMGMSWTLTWWAYNYLPGGMVKRLADTFLFKVACHAASAFGGAMLITSRVDQAVLLYPSVHMAALLTGSLAGCVGLYLEQMLRSGLGLGVKQPLEILQPAFVTRWAFATAAGHYLLVHVWRLLLPQESAAIWVTLWVGHDVAADVLGAPLDLTHPFAVLLGTITGIPFTSRAAPASPHKQAAPKAVAGVKAEVKGHSEAAKQEPKKHK